MPRTLLITLDFPPLTGGIAHYYQQRVAQLDPTEVVILMNKISETKKLDAKIKIYYKKFFCKVIWPHWLPLIWQIIKVVRKEKITELWVGQILPVGTATIIANIFLHLPYRVTCHGNDLLRAKKHPRKFKLARKILAGATEVEANTEFTKNILIRDFSISEDKIKIIRPENTLTKGMANRDKMDAFITERNLVGKQILLSVGRLVESKGFDQVLEALFELKQDFSDLVYLIVGEGPYKKQLTQKAEQLGLADKVFFLGQVDHSELPHYYGLANAFIMTPQINSFGDTESFGIVYLEAAEFGIPIIAGRVGGVEEIIKSEDDGYLVDSENIQDIKNTILKVLK